VDGVATLEHVLKRISPPLLATSGNRNLAIVLQPVKTEEYVPAVSVNALENSEALIAAPSKIALVNSFQLDRLHWSSMSAISVEVMGPLVWDVMGNLMGMSLIDVESVEEMERVALTILAIMGPVQLAS